MLPDKEGFEPVATEGKPALTDEQRDRAELYIADNVARMLHEIRRNTLTANFADEFKFQVDDVRLCQRIARAIEPIYREELGI